MGCACISKNHKEEAKAIKDSKDKQTIPRDKLQSTENGRESTFRDEKASKEEGKIPSLPKPSGLQPVLIPENTERVKHFYDVQQPKTRVKLYEIAKESEFLSFDKASPRDWQQAISRTLGLTSATGVMFATPSNSSNLGVKTQWDHRLLIETTGKILSLPPRDWVQEQLSLYKEQFRSGSDMATTAQRKTLQLQEHFRWFTWAAAAYFYVSIASQNPDLEVDLMREFGELYKKNADTSFVSHPNSSTTSALNFDLPTLPDAWLEGFSFKGVYMKLAIETSKDATVIKSEGTSMEKIGQLFQMTQNELSFSLLFPMSSVVSFGPFLLYATPIIPGSFVGRSSQPTLEIPYSSRPTLSIPKENLLQLFRAGDGSSDISSPGSASISMKPLFMLVNAHLLVGEETKGRFLMFFSCVGSEIRVIELQPKDPPLPARVNSLLKGESRQLDLSKFRSHQVEKFGWVFDVHTDPSDALQKANKAASLLERDVKGDAIVTACEKPTVRKSLYEIKDKGGRDPRRPAIKKVITMLETTDCVSNHFSLSELIHRHRLTQGLSWVILSKLKDERTIALVQTDLLARAVKKYIHYFCQSNRIRTLTDYKDVFIRILSDLLCPQTSSKPQNDELLLLLFLSRLKVVKDAQKMRSSREANMSRTTSNVKKKIESFEFLLRHEVIKDVYCVASRAPGLFLSVLTIAKLDSFSFLAQDPVITSDCVTGFDLKFEGKFGIRETAYISLTKIAEQEADIQRTGNSLQSSALSRSYISEEDIELLNREEEKLPQNFELVLPSQLYAHDSVCRLKDQYELPSLSAINDCIAFVDSLFRDILSAEGKESVVAELLILSVTLTYFQEKDLNKCVQQLRKIGDLLSQCVAFPAELAIAFHLWEGITSETSNLAEAEQHYVTALLLMTHLYGDPRGRGNAGIPWQLLVSSKLSMIGRDENRMQDAVLAEEHFDSVYITTKQYRKLSYAQGNWKHTNTRAEEMSMKYPFEHWSTFAPNRGRGSMSFDDSTVGDNWEGFFACVLQNHLPMFQSGVVWSNAQYKHLLRATKLQTGATQTFVDALGREIKRPALQQSTLSQVLATEPGVLSTKNTKGVVYIWGSDSRGQLGLSVVQDRPHHDMRLPVPRLLTPLKDEIIKEIAIGADHCVAVSLDGKAWSWGDNTKSQLGLGPDAPQMVSTPTVIKTINNVAQASCGYTHTLLLTNDSQVYSVGDADKGILGHGNLNAVFFPKAISALKSVKVRHVECGAFHSVALTNEGYVYTWGEAQGGQLGFHLDAIHKKMAEWGVDGSDLYIHTPTRLYGKLANKRIIQVACGEAHTLALTHDGEVFAWGQNSNGQLGLGFSSEAYVPGKGDELSTRYEPEQVKALSQTIVKKVAASGVYSMFIASDDAVYACGANDFYKLGLEIKPRESNDIPAPTKLDVFRGYSINEVACGIDHALAIGTDPHRMLWSWGKNRDGQLGIGTESQYASPRPIQSMSNAALFKAACGTSTSMIIVGNPTLGQKKRIPKDETEQNWGLILIE